MKRILLVLAVVAIMAAMAATPAFAMPKERACDIVIDKASVKGAYQSGCSKS
jgi:hypothetical protein